MQEKLKQNDYNKAQEPQLIDQRYKASTLKNVLPKK
jgi:hypothetical protein